MISRISLQSTTYIYALGHHQLAEPAMSIYSIRRMKSLPTFTAFVAIGEIVARIPDGSSTLYTYKRRWIEMNKTVFETSGKPEDEIGVI